MILIEKCLICGKDFENGHSWKHHKLTRKEYYDQYIKTEKDGICIVCGEPTSWNRTYYRSTCSIKCAANSQERKDKIKNTNLIRYGVENPYQIADVKQHSIDAIKNNQRNYKCLNCGINTGIKKFCSEECKVQYKENNNSYNNREQAKQTCIELFDGKMNGGAWETRFSNIEQFEKEHNCTSTNKIYTKYGQAVKLLNLPKIMINNQNSAISNEYLSIIEKFVGRYKNISNHSLIEDVIIEDIKNVYDGEIIHNTRNIIKPLELDIYLPDLKLAIEYNGIYWHSNIHKDKDYHLNKSLLCREQNIRLIHIYEFENYLDQIELVQNLILGNDMFPPKDFNKNNLIKNIPNPEIIYNENRYLVYGAGKLY